MLILIYFLFINFTVYGDPLKILLIQNNIAEENFINFLKNSNQNFSFFNLVNFIMNILIPINLLSSYTTSFGITLLISIFFLSFKKNYYPLFYLIIILLLVNIFTLRIFIDENHTRNYILPFFFILLIAFENKKFLNYFLIKVLLVLQFSITQLGFIYLNYNNYIGYNYNKFAYNYENEKFISQLINSKEDTIVLSEIDGNLFKDYKFLNIDVYNFSPKIYFNKTLNFLKNENDIKTLVIIFKKRNKFI